MTTPYGDRLRGLINMLASPQTNEQRHHAAKEAKAELKRLEEFMDSAPYDCHRGPGTTEPGCGGCITCLLREIEVLKASSDRQPYSQSDLFHARQALIQEGMARDELRRELETVKGRISAALERDAAERKQQEADAKERAAKSAEPAPAKFKWTCEIEVDEVWVADGFNLTADRLHQMLRRDLGFARYDELHAAILSAPDLKAIRRAQGYDDRDEGSPVSPSDK